MQPAQVIALPVSGKVLIDLRCRGAVVVVQEGHLAPRALQGEDVIDDLQSMLVQLQLLATLRLHSGCLPLLLAYLMCVCVWVNHLAVYVQTVTRVCMVDPEDPPKKGKVSKQIPGVRRFLDDTRAVFVKIFHLVECHILH